MGVHQSLTATGVTAQHDGDQIWPEKRGLETLSGTETDRLIETDVLIVDATPTANAAYLTIDGLSAAEIGLTGDRRDSPEQFFIDIVADGLYLSNQRMVEAYVRENAPATRELLDWGMKVYSFEEAHSQKYIRGINTSGKEVLRALGRGISANPPAWLEDHMVVDLLTRDGAVCGAVALDQRYGTISVIRCKAVVIATGGWQGGWFLNSASTDGDGQAMA